MDAKGKHPGLIVRRRVPLNAETPLELLCATTLTPNELFFVRNHGETPNVDPSEYRLRVVGLVDQPLSLSLPELRARFEAASVDAVVACAGNRRADLAEVRDFPGELMWGAGAVGCARWTGVRLRDVLVACGVRAGARHVAFTGLDRAEGGAHGSPFGGSIPLEKAVAEEVLLAYELNGEELPPVHGFPLRAVVPGYIGSRSVKWLAEIAVRAEPSDNFFQVHDYTLEGAALQELPLNSAIASVREGVAEGYALAGSQGVARVEVSLDGGVSWVPAELADDAGPWAWRLWRAALPAGTGQGELTVRAWDRAGRTQPEDVAAIWNPKGYMCNAWHRARVSR